MRERAKDLQISIREREREKGRQAGRQEIPSVQMHFACLEDWLLGKRDCKCHLLKMSCFLLQWHLLIAKQLFLKTKM